MSRCKTSAEHTFYLQLCVRDHLSSRQLDRQIDAALYERTKVATITKAFAYYGSREHTLSVIQDAFSNRR